MAQYLGVDLGTQSVKVVVFDAEAEAIVARGQDEVLAPSSPRPGAAEQDPADWWQAFDNALHAALQQPGVYADQIRALGVSGQQHGFVALDEQLQVLRAAKLWCDVEAVEEARQVSKLVGRAVPAGFTAPKILWMQEHESELFQRLRYIALPHDWLNLRLSGVLGTDHGDASGTGLYDPIAGAYQMDAAAQISPELPQMLLPLLEPTAPHSRLLPHWSKHFGLPEDLPISVGSGDNMMSALGAGASEDGTWILSLGTSGTIFGHSEQAVLDPSGCVAPFRDALGGGLPLVCTQNCTTVVEEARAASNHTHPELTAAAQQLTQASDVPLFLPYLSGERTPDWPHAKGVLFGLGVGSLQPAVLYRAAIEGASLALAQGLRHLQALELPVQRLRLVGGGARNPLWARILCDMVQQPLEILVEQESAALGAALQARWMESDVHPKEYGPKRRGEPLQPDSAWASHYAEKLQAFTELGQQLFG
ncbi:MAG: xylulokinase [Planctomycetes bacterium]|nr:xylulokinase [Planctomycetota bacterium]MCP4770429.1 xylulokinase [Planctomycetota bacterium]MCP4862230.1 xylulokinase [Planctomycetota bacterium]